MCARMFPEESDKIERYVGGLPDMIHGSVMASKPKTVQDAVEFATELMDKKIRTLLNVRLRIKGSKMITNNKKTKGRTLAGPTLLGMGRRIHMGDLSHCVLKATITMMVRVLLNATSATELAIWPMTVGVLQLLTIRETSLAMNVGVKTMDVYHVEFRMLRVRTLESTLPLNEINSQIHPSIVITTSPPVLPIEDPEDSLIMGNEELNTIPEKESDEFIKSSVKDFIPILSEFEDTSRSDSACILPSCDDFSPSDIPEEKAVTFSNPLFNSNDDFISSDDESLYDEDVLKVNVKIYSNTLFEFKDEYISSDVNLFFDEVLEDIECKDSYDPNLDELTFLVTPLFDSNKDEYFTPGDDVELLLHHDPSIPKMSVASILEGITNEPPLKENDDLFDLESMNDNRKKILYDAPIADLMFEDKIFNPGIHDQIFSPTYDCPDFEDSRARSFIHRPLEFQSLA
nr:hypothetical protein [Tanacetum cinerariifolium]